MLSTSMGWVALGVNSWVIRRTRPDSTGKSIFHRSLSFYMVIVNNTKRDNIALPYLSVVDLIVNESVQPSRCWFDSHCCDFEELSLELPFLRTRTTAEFSSTVRVLKYVGQLIQSVQHATTSNDVKKNDFVQNSEDMMEFWGKNWTCWQFQRFKFLRKFLLIVKGNQRWWRGRGVSKMRAIYSTEFSLCRCSF